MAVSADTTVSRTESFPNEFNKAKEPPGETVRLQEAQDRLLGYLKALGISPLESLTLAKQVVGRLYRERNRRSVAPVQDAMRMLHRLLENRASERQLCIVIPEDGSVAGGCGPRLSGNDCASGIPLVFQPLLAPYGRVRIVPPLARGGMPACKLPR